MRTSAVLFALVAVQQAVATDSSPQSWNDYLSLPSCSQASNQCTDQQKQGLELATANIKEGSCGSYAGFDLQGLSYGSFGGKSKRDLFSRNGGQSTKCLSGSVSKDSGFQVSCGASIPNQKASISNMQISVEKDTDVHFIHAYAGSDKTCSYVKSCSAGSVNSIDNTQCGGSTSVQCQLPPSSPHESCNVGIHSIGFDCTPAQQQSSAPVSAPQQSSPPKASPLSISPSVGTAPAPGPQPPKSSPPFPIPSGPSAAPAGTAPAPSVPSQSVPATSAPVESASATTAPVESAQATTAALTTPLAQVNTTAPIPVQASTVEQVTSEVVYTTVTSCPVSKTISQGGSTIVSLVTELSTVKVTSTMTICTRCVAPPEKTGSIAPPVPVNSTPAESQAASTAPAPSAAPAPSSAAPALPSAAPAPFSAASAPSSAPKESQVATTAPEASSVPPAPPVVPQTTQAIVTTEIVFTTLTTCPVTNTITPPHGTPIAQVTTTISTIISTTTSTICTKCIAPQTSSPPPGPPAPSAPAASQVATTVAPPAASQAATTVAPPAVVATSSTPAVAPSAPSVLPQCLKTWVTVTKCKGNSDYNCFCQNDSFTQSVYECISAWESDNAQQQAAMSLYAGICAQHVPAHPAIVTAVPSTVTLVPTPASSTPSTGTPAANSPAPTAAPGSTGAAAVAPAGSAPAVSAAVPAGTTPVGTTPAAQAAAVLPPTTIFISTTITLPCPSGAGVKQIPDGQIQAATSMVGGCTTTSLLQTAVTVPQVALSTGASSSVGLVAGPAPVQAAATGAPAAGVPGVAAGVPGVAAGSSSAVIAKPTGSIPFTGAASKSSVSMVFVAAVAGLLVFA